MYFFPVGISSMSAFEAKLAYTSSSIFSFSSQIYGEEIEYAEDIFSSAGPGGGGVTRRSSKKGKLGANHGDSSSTSPERNRKDDLVRENY